MGKSYDFTAILAISAALLVTSSCAPLAHDPKETYVLITANLSLPYWQTALSGLNRAASEMKVRAEMEGPDAYDPKAVYDTFRRAIQRKPSGILLWAVDAELMTPGINAAVAQGIPVVTINADAPKSKRLFFIGTDNYKAGILAGRLTIDLLKGKGNVAIFSTPAPGPARDRIQGYRDAISAHDGIKVARVVDVKGDPTIAFDTTKQLIETKAGISAFVCFSATAGPEVGDVVNRAGMAGKIPIVAMDADPRTLELIQKGVISTAVAQKPFTMTYYGLKLLDDLHHHPPSPLNGDWTQNAFSPIPSFIDTGAFVIDKGNAGTLIQQQAIKTQ